MNKIKDFTDAERLEYKKLYGDIITHINTISEYLSFDDFKNRKFVNASESIRKYIEVLDEADRKADGSGLFEIFKSDEKYKDEALNFKRSISKDIRTVKKCIQCSCSKCILKCNQNGCANCKQTEIVKNCDTQNYSLFHGMNNIELIHHQSNQDVKINFRVCGRLIENETEREFIFLQDTTDDDNIHMYQYFKNRNGEIEYLPIEDYDELVSLNNTFLNLNGGTY